MPTAVTEPESSSTSQSCAIRCIQRATTATKCPMAKMRKLGTRSEMNVWRHGSRSLTTAIGWVTLGAGAVCGGGESAQAAESVTGWLTVAVEGGGGATVNPQGCGWAGYVHAMVARMDYGSVLFL